MFDYQHLKLLQTQNHCNISVTFLPVFGDKCLIISCCKLFSVFFPTKICLFQIFVLPLPP